jgi:hypothetical protein
MAPTTANNAERRAKRAARPFGFGFARSFPDMSFSDRQASIDYHLIAGAQLF